MKRFALAVAVLIVVSGCVGSTTSPNTPSPTPSEPWNVAIFVEEIVPERNGTLEATIGPGGITADESLEGVEIILMDENKDVIEEIPVGNLTSGETKNFNATVSTLPLYVSVKIDRLNVSQPENGAIEGLYITEDGEIEGYDVQSIENYSQNTTLSEEE